MNILRNILLMLLLTAFPVLSACSMLGLGSSQSEKDEYYRQQIETYNQIQEANQKRQEEYNKKLEESLNQWASEYQNWQNQQQLQELQQAGVDTANVTVIVQTDNQS